MVNSNTTSFSIRKASLEDISTLSNVLADSLKETALTSWLVPKDKYYKEKILNYSNFLLQLAVPHELIYTTEKLEGAALWIPPHKWEMNLMQEITLLPKVIKYTGVKQFISRISGLTKLTSKHPKDAHYYLMTVGVKPEVQGKGIGSSLLQPVLLLADTQGIPCYLETSNEKTLGLYKKHGFSIINTIQLPFGGPHMWLLWRPSPNNPSN